MINKCNNCKCCNCLTNQNGRDNNSFDGTNDKMVIAVDRVYDACMSRISGEKYTVTLLEISPICVKAPFEFESLKSAGETEISDLIITPIENGKSRVRFTSTIPVVVMFKDCNGVQGIGKGFVDIKQDIVMKVPHEILTPYSIKVNTVISSNVGKMIDDMPIEFIMCAVQIIKVVVPVEIMVQSYGYASYPPAIPYEYDQCSDLFDLPIFPEK